MAGVTLVVDAATVVLADRPVLAGVSISVDPGEVVAVVGPSGSGKTTLLRAVAGLAPLSSGSVAIDGEDQATVPVHRRGIGVVAQDGALFPHRDVGRNVGFGLRVQGWDRDDAAARVAEVLDLVGLTGFGPRPVQQLSGGERQRVALARALAPRPKLLLLDEPFGSLDRTLRARMVEELAVLTADLGLSVLHVTHDQEEAGALAHRLVVLRDGAVVQAGPPAAVHAAPDDDWVARFLGHRNVLRVDDLPSAVRAALAPGAADGVDVLVPEAALVLRGPGDVVAAGALRGSVVTLHRPPARPGTQIDVDGVSLWATEVPTAAEVGDEVVLEVKPGTIRILARHRPVADRVREEQL